MQIAIILHNIRSSHNVGSIFRTADAAGISHVYLTGYTPTPIDRFGRAQKEIAKTALGAQRSVPHTYTKILSTCIKKLKQAGWHIVGVEQDSRAIEYRNFTPADDKVAFLFGNEVRGLSPSARALCDALIEIPMRGEKESLNVAVAVGIVLFSWHS